MTESRMAEGSEARVDEVVAAWCARDRTRALVPEDHAVIESTMAARAFVIEQVLAGGNADLYHGCLVLGRLIAERGGSPTLAASTLDGALDALTRAGITGERAWVPFARAALASGYDAGRVEEARRDAARAWDFPRCAVRIDGETMAFAASIPDDDDDVVGEWAARVALAAQRAKVRRAIVDGLDGPRRALADALSLAGIEVVTPRAGKSEGQGGGKSAASWFTWLRRGSR